MLALRNFILYGVTWEGHTDDAKFMQSRAARVLLQSLADQTNIKNPSGGIQKSRPALAGYLYERSTVSASLKRLQALGLVERKRAGRKGGVHEDFATTSIVTELVVASLSWQKECQRLKKAGKRDTAARPAKTVLQIPLKSTPPAGEPSPERAAEDQHPNPGHISYQNLETISIYTPPQSCAAAAGEPGPAPALDRYFRGVGGRETLPPVFIPASIDAFSGRQNFKNFRPFPGFSAAQQLQNFINWLFMVNRADDLTAVTLMQMEAPGKLEIYKKGSRALTAVNPLGLLTMVFAKSWDAFAKTGSGEQLYFSPREGSRVVLVDDISTDQPLFPGHQCAVIETSCGNFQHFYVCERGLQHRERQELQTVLARQFGGDLKATNGHQPHRAPGSVNYKPGRGCFVARLVFCTAAGAVLTAPTAREVEASTLTDEGDTRLNEPRVGGVKSPSEVDWAWLMSNWHLGEPELTRQLQVTSMQRGKHHSYAAHSVESARKFKNSRATAT